MINSIAILDFGSQYAQLIARRVRETHVYCELFPWDTPAEKVLAIKPKGFILSGGPKSVYEANAPYIQKYILESGLPDSRNLLRNAGAHPRTRWTGGSICETRIRFGNY